MVYCLSCYLLRRWGKVGWGLGLSEKPLMCPFLYCGSGKVASLSFTVSRSTGHGLPHGFWSKHVLSAMFPTVFSRSCNVFGYVAELRAPSTVATQVSDVLTLFKHRETTHTDREGNDLIGILGNIFLVPSKKDDVIINIFYRYQVATCHYNYIIANIYI